LEATPAFGIGSEITEGTFIKTETLAQCFDVVVNMFSAYAHCKPLRNLMKEKGFFFQILPTQSLTRLTII